VRAELIETAMTLGASRWQILSTIVLPAVAPKIMISMRQMLAVSWTYLVIAEIVASVLRCHDRERLPNFPQDSLSIPAASAGTMPTSKQHR